MAIILFDHYDVQVTALQWVPLPLLLENFALCENLNNVYLLGDRKFHECVGEVKKYILGHKIYSLESFSFYTFVDDREK